jgi:hypothetical protein
MGAGSAGTGRRWFAGREYLERSRNSLRRRL